MNTDIPYITSENVHMYNIGNDDDIYNEMVWDRTMRADDVRIYHQYAHMIQKDRECKSYLKWLRKSEYYPITDEMPIVLRAIACDIRQTAIRFGNTDDAIHDILTRLSAEYVSHDFLMSLVSILEDVAGYDFDHAYD